MRNEVHVVCSQTDVENSLNNRLSPKGHLDFTFCRSSQGCFPSHSVLCGQELDMTGWRHNPVFWAIHSPSTSRLLGHPFTINCYSKPDTFIRWGCGSISVSSVTCILIPFLKNSEVLMSMDSHNGNIWQGKEWAKHQFLGTFKNMNKTQLQWGHSCLYWKIALT